MNTGDNGIFKSIAIKKDEVLLSGEESKNKRLEIFLLKFSTTLVFIVLMWLSANSFIYLPFTPVPVTMQVLTVLLSGILLGPYWAFTAQVEYVLLGISGFPVFAGFKSGFAALAGPTGGYILSFALAAWLTGYLYSIFSADIARRNKPVFSGRLIIFFSCLDGTFSDLYSRICPSGRLFICCRETFDIMESFS